MFVGRGLRTRLDLLKPYINETIKKQRSEKIAKGEPVLNEDYRDSNKWNQGVVVHKLGSVTYQIQDLIWRYILLRFVNMY